MSTRRLLILTLCVILATEVINAFEQHQQLITGSPLLFTGGEHARGPVRYQYSVNLLVKLNSTLRLQTFNNSRAIYWALTKYSANDASLGLSPVPTPIYNVANPAIRNNQTIRSQFLCTPSDTECNQISVFRFNNFRYLGSYSYQSLINTLDSLYVDYNVSAAVEPIQMSVECAGGSSRCFLNSTSGENKLTVLANELVRVSCSILIGKKSFSVN